SMGKVAVKIYYFISPSLIKVIKNRQRITQIIRMGLENIIDLIMYYHHVRYTKIGIEKSEGR
ncbi:MAG: hypothetical protein PHQ90_12205, partial [Sulfuricurvum sp.]|nr:hypothetical protein [Sulfuricurvum sp.]MDD2950410.1 hypothetical protein [Sulfuricurvum sp.]